MSVSKQATKARVKAELKPVRDIPEHVAGWLAKWSDEFSQRTSMERDIAKLQAMSKSGLSTEGAKRIAFVLWRARCIRSLVEVKPNPTAPDGVMPWKDAVMHANLRDAIWDIANERRLARKAENEATFEHLNQVRFERVNGKATHSTRKEREQAAEAKRIEEETAKAQSAEKNTPEALPPVEERLADLVK